MYINMLVTGRAGSGKTVAVCNMYHQMTKRGCVGDKVEFGLVAQGDTAIEDHIHLREMNINMLKNELLPWATLESVVYDFAFMWNMKTICDIHWMYYRGALTDEDPRDPMYKEDWEIFRSISNHTALLIYVISGEVIDKYIRAKEAVLTDEEKVLLEMEVHTEINLIKTLIGEARRNWERETKKDDTRPILFYVTKSDLIKYDDERKLKELVLMLDKYGLLGNNRKILSCHSTLGRNLILSEDNRILDGLEPKGFEIPLMVAVGYALSKEGKKWERDENTRLDALIANTKMEKGNKLNKFLINLMLQRKENKRIMELNQQININNNEFQKLRNEKVDLESKNTLSEYSQDILDYIENLGAYAIYVDEKGEVQSLEYFFNKFMWIPHFTIT